MTKHRGKNKGLGLGRLLTLFKNNEKTSGELTVSGTDSLSFEIKCKHYGRVKAWFVDMDPDNVPCNPGTEDTLSYCVEPIKGSHCLLKLSWKVSGIRLICWTTEHHEHDKD